MSMEDQSSQSRSLDAPPYPDYLTQGNAPAQPGRRIPWLWLTIGIVALVVIVGGTTAAVFALTGWDGKPAAGDTAFTVKVRAAGGGTAAPGDIDHARQILLSRMRATKLTRPTVTRQGTDVLVVTVAPKDADRARALLTAGNLTFRKVLVTTPNPVAAGADKSCTPDTGTGQDHAAALASAKRKLGPAYEAASQIQDPTQADRSLLSAFDGLTCDELAAIPAQMQFMVPNVTCGMLNGRGPGALDDPTDAVVACDQPGTTKYALDVAKVRGTDVATADAKYDPNQGGWLVQLHFTSAGQARWTALTQEAMQNAQQSGGAGGAQVAIVLDNTVLSAPQIQSVITGDAIISGGGIDQNEASAIAADLRYGALPVSFTIESITQVR